MIITIDGPSASGKSSVAQQLARQLHYIHINSGLLYRAAAVLYLRQAQTINPDFLQSLTNLQYRYDPTTQQVQLYYQGEDLTPQLKTTQVSQLASIISTNLSVREIINQLQRDLVATNPHTNFIADGRDCGSVVFPQADLKIFLTASLAVRAERFRQDLIRKQLPPLTIAASLAELAERDQRDQTRAVAPLIVPTGAVVIDSSALSLAEVVQKIEQLIRAN